MLGLLSGLYRGAAAWPLCSSCNDRSADCVRSCTGFSKASGVSGQGLQSDISTILEADMLGVVPAGSASRRLHPFPCAACALPEWLRQCSAARPLPAWVSADLQHPSRRLFCLPQAPAATVLIFRRCLYAIAHLLCPAMSVARKTTYYNFES